MAIFNCPIVSNGYAYMWKQGPTWADVHGVGSADDKYEHQGPLIYANDYGVGLTKFVLSRGFARIDLSLIPLTSTVLSAKLKGTGHNDVGFGIGQGYLAPSRYVGADPWALADFDDVGPAYGTVVLHDNTNAAFEVSLDALAISDINAAVAGSGEWTLALRNKGDIQNIAPDSLDPENTMEEQEVVGSSLYLEVETTGECVAILDGAPYVFRKNVPLDWDACHDATSADLVSVGCGADAIDYPVPNPTEGYLILRTALIEPLSLIPVGATIVGAELRGHGDYGIPANPCYLRACQFLGSYPPILDDYDEFDTESFGVVVLPSSYGNFVMVLNAAAVAYLNSCLGDIAYLGLKCKLDWEDTTPTTDSDTWDEQNLYYGDLKLYVYYLSTPVVSSCSPAIYGRGQSVEVVISGMAFTGASAVSFGSGITVDSFVVDTDAQITAQITISGAATLGLRDVSVTNMIDTGTLVDGFEVMPKPTVTSATPNHGVQDSEITTLVIAGSGFDYAWDVNLGDGISFGGGGWTIDSDIQITADIIIDPAATPGSRDITVTTDRGVAVLVHGFVVTSSSGAPTIVSVTPAVGHPGDHLASVVITGYDL